MATNNLPDPIVTNPISNLIVNIDAPDTTLSLSNYFDDPLTTGKVAHFNLANTSAGTIGNGTINVVLFDQTGIGAPLTVQNFQSYVSVSSYTNSFIHRSIPGFIVQGGGYTYNNSTLGQIPANSPVQNEFSPNRSNLRGTIAMAKLGNDPNSATNQWFFNLADNSTNLDNQNGGFTVFGQALSANDLTTIDAIAAVPIYNTSTTFTDLPLTAAAISDTNFVRFSSVTVSQEDELQFSIVSNSQPTLVTPKISNKQLVLDYLPNQTGNSDITIRATNLFGEFIDYKFTATVLPSISLALSPTSISEDSPNNLIYTFTRNGDLSTSLTANYSVTGTAIFNTDYTPIGAASFTANTGSITFAVNSATATLTIGPTADTTIESDETVAVTLATNVGYTLGTTTAVTATITNDDFPVVNINKVPTLNTIANPAAILEDAVTQTINLSGISAGIGESQTLTVKTTSNNSTLIANPIVTYNSPNSTATLSYTPIANQSGTALITVTVQDNGGTANGGIDTVAQNFTVNVTAVNDPVTGSPTAVLASGTEDTVYTIQTSSLLQGFNDVDIATSGQSLSVLNLIATNGTLANNNNGTYSFTPAANYNGIVTLTYDVTDSNGSNLIDQTRTFNLVAVNDTPVLKTPLLDQTAKSNSAFTFTLPRDTFSDPDAVNSYKNLVIFGDSLSDTGNAYKASGNTFPAPPNYQGRLSNGLIWADYFAPDLQFTDQSIQNYAFLGANTGISNIFNQVTVPGLLTQIQQFKTLNANSLGKDGLYVIWAGANDFLSLTTDPTQAVTNAVTNISSAIATLAGLGAKEIIVGNLTDLGATPLSIASNNVANARAISIGFNTALNQALNNLEPALNIDLTLVDIFGLSTAVQANPANYKFTNITQPLITATNPVDPNQYAFWDTVHPTTRLHQLVTDTFENTLLNENVISDLVKYSATLENGNALPSWLTFNPITRIFSGTPTNDNVGNLNIKAIATDKAGATVSDIFTLAIGAMSNNAPTLANPIADQNSKQGSVFNFQIPVNTFTDIDAGDVLTYSTTLENGNALPSWLTFNPTTRTFSGTPTNDNGGNFSVKAIATDKAKANVSDIFVIAIENINDAPTLANPIADQNAKQGSVFNFQIPVNTFTDIDAGDVLTYSTTLENGNTLPSWLTFNPTTRTFSGTPTNDNVGNFSVKAIATDKAGATVSDIFVIAVEKIIDNKPQSIGTPGDDKLIATPGSPFDGQNNIVFTGAGKDEVDLSTVSVLPNSGNNTVDLGTGDDIIYVNKGDRAFGSDGNDTFDARNGQGSNRMSGGFGNDTFFLRSNDRALGGDGNDKFYVGLGGGNLISGGAGTDQFWIINAELPKAANTILDFQIGTDVIGINAAVSLGITTSTLKLNQVGADTAISFNNQTLAILTGIQANNLSLTNTNQFIFA